MTAKEIFRSRLKEQIDVLTLQYESSRLLPDSLFENLEANPISKPVDMPSANVFKLYQPPPKTIPELPDGIVNISEYGVSKQLLLSIIRNNGKSIQKGDVIEIFAERSGKSTIEITNTVTNGLSSLKDEGLIIGYKPAGLKFKGLFWSLKEWWKDDKILQQYEPYSEKLKYL